MAISCALRSGEGFRVWSLGDLATGEAELVQRFFDGIEKFSPDLVSWNGSGFDLPVLHLPRARAPACRRRVTGKPARRTTAFRYNNYLSRYHWRHIDLMDVLSGFQGRGARYRSPDMATLLGLPGKLGFDGSQVWDAWQGGRPRRHPPLLRDRRAQHLARSTCALRCCAASSRASSTRERARARAQLPAPPRASRTSPRSWRLAGALEWQSSAAQQNRQPCAVSASRTQGEGVVHGGKTAFVAGALPGERIRFRRTRRHRQHDEGELLEVLEPAERSGSRRAARISASAAAAPCSTSRPRRSSPPRQRELARHSDAASRGEPAALARRR